MKAALAKIGHGAKPSAEDAPVFLLPVLVPLWNAWRDLHSNDREYSPVGGIGSLPRDAIRERLRDVDQSVRALWRRLLAVLEAEYRVASSEMWR